MRDEVSHLCHTELRNMARPAGLEPATPGLEGRCSIQLSYGRTWLNGSIAPRVAFRAEPAARDPMTREGERRTASREPRSVSPVS
jgi:hypothetical protein